MYTAEDVKKALEKYTAGITTNAAVGIDTAADVRKALQPYGEIPEYYIRSTAYKQAAQKAQTAQSGGADYAVKDSDAYIALLKQRQDGRAQAQTSTPTVQSGGTSYAPAGDIDAYVALSKRLQSDWPQAQTSTPTAQSGQTSYDRIIALSKRLQNEQVQPTPLPYAPQPTLLPYAPQPKPLPYAPQPTPLPYAFREIPRYQTPQEIPFNSLQLRQTADTMGNIGWMSGEMDGLGIESKWKQPYFEQLTENLKKIGRIIGQGTDWVNEKIDEEYQKLPRKYDKLLDGYGLSKPLKYAVTFAINHGGGVLDVTAKKALNSLMGRDLVINFYNAEANKRNNQQYQFDDFIEKQREGDAAKIKMGLKNGDYNGCGWVATYNVLKLLGKDMQPWEIVEYYDKSGGAMIDGMLGINSEAIVGFFRKQGAKTAIDYFPDNIDEQIKRSGTAIIEYLHVDGGHYAAVRYKNGIFTVYNADAAPIDSVDQWIQEKGYLPLSVITVEPVKLPEPNSRFIATL